VRLDGARLFLALIAALVASIMTGLLLLQLAPILPYWLTEALACAGAAAVWMLVASHIAPSPFGGSVLSFAVGTAVAWFFTRGLVHSTSPYYGLVALLAAILAAAATWLVICRNRREQTIALTVAVLALLLATGGALATPVLGVVRTFTDDRGGSRSVHIHSVRDTTYLWTEAVLDPSSPVHVELDPGSGAGRYRLLPVPAGANRRLICDGFRARTDSLVSSEVALGHTPRFVTALPFRMAACEVGHMWALRAWQ